MLRGSCATCVNNDRLWISPHLQRCEQGAPLHIGWTITGSKSVLGYWGANRESRDEQRHALNQYLSTETPTGSHSTHTVKLWFSAQLLRRKQAECYTCGEQWQALNQCSSTEGPRGSCMLHTQTTTCWQLHQHKHTTLILKSRSAAG